MNQLIGFSLTLISVYLIFTVLKAAQSFFIPFLIAFVIAYFILGLVEVISKISLGRLKIPNWLAYLVALGIIFGGLYSFGLIISRNISSLIESAPVYQMKLQGLIDFVSNKIGKSLPDLTEKLKEFNFASLFSQLAFVLTEIASNTGLIVIYLLFILIESYYFDDKLMAIISSKEGKESAKKMLNKIGVQTRSYVRIKTLISFLTGFFSYGVLIFVGVDFPEFWALLIFLLNFIPAIGSIIATIFPLLMSAIQFGEVLPVAIVAFGLIGIQFVLGNVIEPKIMGKQFNLSGLVIIISLALWGQIWGIIGMLLCVPMMMIVSIILSNFEKTRWIAILLSQTGELSEE